MLGDLLHPGFLWRQAAKAQRSGAPLQDSSDGPLAADNHKSAQSPESLRKAVDQVQELQRGHGPPEGAPRQNAGELKEALRHVAAKLPHPGTKSPLFTIITPVYNSKPEWLVEAALSVFQQTLSDWEWCIVDDCSQRTELDSTLSLFEHDPRVKISRLNRITASAVQ